MTRSRAPSPPTSTPSPRGPGEGSTGEAAAAAATESRSAAAPGHLAVRRRRTERRAIAAPRSSAVAAALQSVREPWARQAQPREPPSGFDGDAEEGGAPPAAPPSGPALGVPCPASRLPPASP